MSIMRAHLCLLLVVLSCSDRTTARVPDHYPDSKRIDHTDDYHGQKVADPYRWLEDDVRESAEVADWVTRQNEVSFGYLKQIPHRDEIDTRIEPT